MLHKSLSVICCMVFTVAVYAQKSASVAVLSQTETATILKIQLPQLQFATANNNEVKAIALGATSWLQAGMPDVPKYTTTIQIPNAKEGVLSILDETHQDAYIPNMAPSKGNLSRLVNPADVPYTKGASYTNNTFFPSQIAQLNEPFIYRDYRGQTIHLAVAQYNAMQQLLRTYITITVKITYSKASITNILHQVNTPEYMASEALESYKNRFVNFDINADFKKTRYTPLEQDGKLLILCPNKYLATLEPFVTWKKQKGIYTTVVKTDSITGGTTDDNIKTFINTYYAQHNNLYVILVGDNSDIPAYNELNNKTTVFAYGDNPYGYISGNDHYAEIIVGRLSAGNTVQLKSQIDKIIAYEKNQNTSSTWMQSLMAIGSDDPTGGDDNQRDWEHERDIADSMINQGPFVKKYELYDGSKGGNDSIGAATPQEFTNAVNNGVSLINYTGHGFTSGIVTSAFDNSQVPTLSNTDGKWPIMMAVGCKPGYFIGNTCFAENMQWATNNNKPSGLVASAMSTVDQWWEPPMQAQDEANAILRGARLNNLANKFGPIMVNGFASMMDQYNTTANPEDGNQMTDTWELFGDPTMVLFTKNNGTLQVTHPTKVGSATTTVIVNCNVNDALVCLYYQGEIIGTAKVLGGIATFTLVPANLILGTNITVTVTKYNNVTYQGTILISNDPASLQAQLAAQFQIYPNPVSHVLYINNAANINSVSVINNLGQQLLLQEFKNQNRATVNINSLSNGLYILQINSTQGTVYKQFQKQ
jgi:gingipain R